MARYRLALLAGILLIPALALVIDQQATVCDSDSNCRPRQWCLAQRCRPQPKQCSHETDCAAGDECVCLEIRDSTFGDTSYKNYCLTPEARAGQKNVCRQPTRRPSDLRRLGPSPD